jgi:hypothetical protein
MSQNRKKAEKFVPKLNRLGISVVGDAFGLVFNQNGAS